MKKLCPLANEVPARRQFGFRPSSSILTPVLEVDSHAARRLRPLPSGGALFYDSFAAFPSLAHAFLWVVLRESGLPDFVVRATMAL